jgi:hypothetical protein
MSEKGQQRSSNHVCVTSAITPIAARSATSHWLAMLRLLGVGYRAVLLSAFVWGTMKNDSLWRGTLVVAFAIGAGWIGYMGWPLNGLITRAAEQSNSPNRSQALAVFQDPNCPGNDKHALMCRLVNEYRAKHGLKPVQLDGLVTREAQYWSDQLNRQNACWFLYHDSNYHARMRARFPGRRFRENAACSG